LCVHAYVCVCVCVCEREREREQCAEENICLDRGDDVTGGCRGLHVIG
jgi:hypothetical protein